MKQRIISAFFGIIVLVAVMLGGNVIFDIAVMLISSMAIYEVISAIRIKRNSVMTLVSMLLPVVVMIVSHINREYIFSVVYLFIAVYLIMMLFNHGKYTFSEVARYIAVSVMITLSFIHISFVRAFDNGIICVFIVFIGSWITDTCAYFTGMAIGKHKLAPKISPKKTIEGSIGGVVGVTIIITAYTLICANIINMNVNIYSMIAVGLLSGVLSQFGDLCASIIKRENDVKDFGNIMPGHGGVMDRFDSFLFVAPALYYVLKFFPVFV